MGIYPKFPGADERTFEGSLQLCEIKLSQTRIYSSEISKIEKYMI